MLNIIFLYRLTMLNGYFKALQNSISGVTEDRRLQLLLVAFCFGAFFEGAAGFGTPVAVTGAILIGLGFSPLAASGLALIANTAPVAYGALGTPVIALAEVTGLDLLELSAMIGRQLPFFSLLVPFWLIWAFAGFRGMLEIWPAILVAGVSFAVPQFLVSNYHGPLLVDVIAALVSMACLTLFLQVWQPRKIWTSHRARRSATTSSMVQAAPEPRRRRGARRRASAAGCCAPGRRGCILPVFVFVWGTAGRSRPGSSTASFGPRDVTPMPGLAQRMVVKVPPVVAKPAPEARCLRLQHAVHDRHRHPGRGHRRRPGHGLRAGRACCRNMAERSSWCAIRC